MCFIGKKGLFILDHTIIKPVLSDAYFGIQNNMEIIYIPQSSNRIYELITINDEDQNNKNCSPCSNCKECLADRAYFVWWHNKYCCRCFETLYGQKCAFCQQTITGSKEINFIFYDNQMWHAECFRCPKCYNRLTQTCFSPSHILTCAECGSRIRSTNHH